MKIAFSCIELFTEVPVSFVKDGIGEFFHANAEEIWKLMSW
ncbi:MAG: hypothetical protein MOIL_01340 [Candidatus Methanolliviera sp. GoM_oil]|nr:MAG: hypothetical protein MOIL_01340 [Candidatus Methanolliviera sp. GoM_oil]